VKGLYTWGDRGVRFAWQDLGLSAAGFGFLLVAVALVLFWVPSTWRSAERSAVSIGGDPFCGPSALS